MKTANHIKWLLFIFVFFGAMFNAAVQAEEKLSLLEKTPMTPLRWLIVFGIILGPAFPAGVALLIKWEHDDGDSSNAEDKV
jgi:hypothetical protein